MPPAPPRVRITLREVLRPGDPAVAQAYRILSRSFAAGERVARRDWEASLREGTAGVLTDLAWHLIVAEDPDGRVVGFTSGTYLGSVNVGVIGYLAIAPGLRSGGLGSRLRIHLRRRFARDARRIRGEALAGVIGEVAPDNPWLRTLARREGVILLDVPYLQPRLREGDPPSPFTLYYEPLGTPRTRIPAAELRRILFAIWRRIYRVSRPLERPEFRAMLRALAGRRTVGPPPGARRLAQIPRPDHA